MKSKFIISKKNKQTKKQLQYYHNASFKIRILYANLLDNVIKPLVPEHHLRWEKQNDPVLEWVLAQS